MPTLQLAPLLAKTERHILLAVLRDHPHWRLSELLRLIEGDGPRAALLRDLRIEELLSTEVTVIVRGPLTTDRDRERLEAAQQSSGELFDEFVREVLHEASTAGPGWVSAGYLRERVGGTRWKLQASLARLIDAGVVERTGRTSSTRYRRLSKNETSH